MKRLLISCLLVVGCTSEYERKYGESEGEYETRTLACEERSAAGEYVFTLVSTDRWRVGSTSLWSTPERVRATLGPPDTTYQLPQRIKFGPDIEQFGYGRLGGGLEGYKGVTVVNDSLAYIGYAELGSEPLVTDRGRFEPGVPLAEVREAFPESYECRDWRVGALYLDQFHPVVAATDSARGAHVLLLFRDERLVSVGIDYYMRERLHGSIP